MSSALEKPVDLELSAVPESASNIYTPKKPFQSTILEKYRISDPKSPNYDWHIVLDLKGSELVGKYRIGQSIGVVPEGRFNDPQVNYAHRSLDSKIRLYSIASACWGDDWKGETVSLCVKREFSENAETGELVFGVASNYLCDGKPGDAVAITGPVGKSFLLPDNALDYNYVFVATGTGIAPFRGMLIELFNQGYQRDVWLVFGVPYSTDIMYHDEFTSLAEKHPNFHYITSVSREQKNQRGGKMYVQDRLEENQDVYETLLESQDTLLYMCGLKGMEFGIYQWLCRIGSNLISLPEGLTVEAIQHLQRGDPEWSQIEKTRDKARFFKETY